VNNIDKIVNTEGEGSEQAEIEKTATMMMKMFDDMCNDTLSDRDHTGRGDLEDDNHTS
jgi:hypothetical protein